MRIESKFSKRTIFFFYLCIKKNKLRRACRRGNMVRQNAYHFPTYIYRHNFQIYRNSTPLA